MIFASVPASATGACLNELARGQQPYGSRLPDCRAYEQVSPTSKAGVSVEGEPPLNQASSIGEAVTFFSSSGLPVEGETGSGDFPAYVATRDASGVGWSTHGVLPASLPGTQPQVRAYSPDLTHTVVTAQLPGDLHSENLDLRDNATGAVQQLVEGPHIYTAVALTGDGANLFFESPEQLVPGAAPGVVNLYDLDRGNLTLVGVLPDGTTPPGGSFAGPYRWQAHDPIRGGATFFMYTQGAISSDGSRAVFTAGGTAQLYLRENGVNTVHVSASQRTVPDPNGALPAAFVAATPDDSQVFFTSCEKLTNNSTAVSTAAFSCTQSEQGQDLYRYAGGALTDLTVDSGDPLGAAVQGVLGVSEDGSYVYFVANGVLATGASPGSCQGVEDSGACNLYVWHNGTTQFITQLANVGEPRDAIDWEPTENAPISHHEKASRVTPDGKTLLFGSNQQLTSYDNQGFEEFYSYDAGAGSLRCVSCNPAGVPPTGDATLQFVHPGFFPRPEGPSGVLTRNLSADGGRVFFETPDALVPSDTNEAPDVYEWERPVSVAEPNNSCTSSSPTFDERSGGCLFVISGGTSPEGSFFADASASGNDVFFFTSQQLVGHDKDELVDVYDARVDGGFPQFSLACTGTGCQGVPPAPPIFATPSTATFNGTGNFLPSPQPQPTQKPLTRAQKLATALKACKKKPKKKRQACEKQARWTYGSAHKTKKSPRGGK